MATFRVSVIRGRGGCVCVSVCDCVCVDSRERKRKRGKRENKPTEERVFPRRGRQTARTAAVMIPTSAVRPLLPPLFLLFLRSSSSLLSQRGIERKCVSVNVERQRRGGQGPSALSLPLPPPSPPCLSNAFRGPVCGEDSARLPARTNPFPLCVMVVMMMMMVTLDGPPKELTVGSRSPTDETTSAKTLHLYRRARVPPSHVQLPRYRCRYASLLSVAAEARPNTGYGCCGW